MNKEQIRTAFLKSVEERIESAEQYADNPDFDKLIDIASVNMYGYGFFYPIYPNAFNANSFQFDQICDLFGHLQYCWLDDGDISLVSCTLENKMEVLGKIYTHEHIETFIVNSCKWDLTPEYVLKIATIHGYKDATLKSFVATTFNSYCLDYIHSMIPQYKKVQEMGRQDELHSFQECIKAEEQLEKDFQTFIYNQKYKQVYPPEIEKPKE